MPAPAICIGVITGVHGVRGLVKVQSHTQPVDAIKTHVPIQDEHGKVLALEILSPLKGQFLARLAGVVDRDKAEALRGTKLFIGREALPDTAEGEYYHADLAGMAVLDHTGARVGTVRAVENYGASDILDIKGVGRADFMVPFTEAFVPHIDREARMVKLAAYEVTE